VPRSQSDPGSGRAVIANDVVSVRQDGSLRRIDDPADDADERGFPRAVGAEEREDLALADFQVDVLQRLEAGGVGLGQIGNADDGLHELLYETMSDQEPVFVPYEELSAEALRGVVESFVLREGTEYGSRDFTLEEKLAHVYGQLERREARIVFDPETETIDIIPTRR